MPTALAETRMHDPQLAPIRDKVLQGRRLSFEDGVALYRTHDLLAELRAEGFWREAHLRLGQEPGHYSASLHLMWRMRNDRAVIDAAREGRLRVGLPASWLLVALGSPREHALDGVCGVRMTIQIRLDLASQRLRRTGGVVRGHLSGARFCGHRSKGDAMPPRLVSS